MMSDKSIVLVLWFDAFDELAATLFATTLRKAGLRVKLTGHPPMRATGVSGLALMPELTLEQAGALGDRTAAVILPAGAGAVRRARDDPRLDELIARTHPDTIVVTSAEAASSLAGLVAAPDAAPAILTYADDFGVLACACRLAERLAAPGILPDVTAV